MRSDHLAKHIKTHENKAKRVAKKIEKDSEPKLSMDHAALGIKKEIDDTLTTPLSTSQIPKVPSIESPYQPTTYSNHFYQNSIFPNATQPAKNFYFNTYNEAAAATHGSTPLYFDTPPNSASPASEYGDQKYHLNVVQHPHIPSTHSTAAQSYANVHQPAQIYKIDEAQAYEHHHMRQMYNYENSLMNSSYELQSF